MADPTNLRPGVEGVSPSGLRAVTTLEPDQAAALDIAKRLAAAGLPIFVAAPAPGSKVGFALPDNWERTIPDPAVVDMWRPGMALCAVGGHLCDFLDVDPRNGGHESAAKLSEQGAWPVSYGRAITPSGGTHEIIAPLRTGKGTPAAGMDLQGGRADGTGRGFVFLAPTVRASKVDGIARPYAWVTEPDVPRLVASAPFDRSGEALAALLPEHKGKAKAADDASAFFVEDVPHTVAQAHRTIAEKLAEVTDHAHKGWSGFRNTLNRSSFAIGAYVGQPDGIEHEHAVGHLLNAIRLAGHEPDGDDLRWIETGLEDGATHPIRIVPDRVAPSAFTPPPPVATAAARRLTLTRASGITMRRVRWLWLNKIPLGELSLLGGREGIGKSTVAYQLLADTTRGRLKGEFYGIPRPVIVVATEDSWEHTISPRLVAAEAKGSR